MQDIFITKIKIKEVRNIKDFEINLSETERKHLIITGKNGSGKTSMLEALKTFFFHLLNGNALGNYDFHESKLKELHSKIENLNSDSLDFLNLEEEIKKGEKWFKKFDWFGGTKVTFNVSQELNNCQSVIQNESQEGEFIIKFFEAKRHSQFMETKGVNKIEFKQQYKIDESIGKQFTQHLVNLQFDKLVAKDEKNFETANNIDNWFLSIETVLGNLFNVSNFNLVFDRKNYDYQIVENGNPPYTFNQLPDGYSAILDIVTELIMRMEEHKTKSYDVQGIVLIDEIETHLHIDLQKKILPFLTSFFPKIQFIVTTHSPFVLSSIENAVICDLEKRIVTEDLSDYSYDTIVESYFRNDKYSEILKKKVERYEILLGKNDLGLEETEEFYRLKMELEQAPKFLANELDVKLQQLNLKEKTL